MVLPVNTIESTATTATTATRDTDLAGVLLRPLQGTNAFEAAVEQLATAIRLGAFSDGDRLPPERELAATMGISRATLREAIAALRQAGLVVTRTGRGGGTVVSTGSTAQHADVERDRRTTAQSIVRADVARYRDALVARRVVEPGAAATAARQDLSADQRAWLGEALAEVTGAVDAAQHRQADSRFHLAIATLTGSARLVDLVTGVQRDLHDLLTAIPVLAVNIGHSNAEHEQIVQAILAGDADTARQVMESHCDATAALLRGLLGMDDLSPSKGWTS